MKRFGRALAKWAYGLVGGCLGSGFSALAAKFGLDGLHELGMAVPQFSTRQMGYIFLAGIVSHGILYVKQTPLPPLEFDEDGEQIKEVPKV